MHIILFVLCNSLFILISEAESQTVLDIRMEIKTKRCEVCHVLFRPDRRVGYRQRVCRKLSCQKERKRRSQAAWLKRNPGYFRDRYANTKLWLNAHPGYLRTYRQSQRRNRRLSDIQDELSLDKSIPVSALHDIQDELTACFARHLPCNPDSSYHDIQVELSLLIPALYLGMIYKTRLQR